MQHIRRGSRAAGRGWVWLLALPLLVCGAGAAHAVGEQVFKRSEDFIAEAFDGQPPAPQLLWPSPALQQRMLALLGHRYKQLRIRYWRADRRSAWILEEVGKHEEITIGFVLQGEAIVRTEVLVYREDRGWEIRFPAYTQQYVGARLSAGDRLDRPIDGISGATLSVQAYERLARLALLLHQQLLSEDN